MNNKIKPVWWYCEDVPVGECDDTFYKTEQMALDEIDAQVDYNALDIAKIPKPVPLYSQATVDRLIAERDAAIARYERGKRRLAAAEAFVMAWGDGGDLD